MMQHNHKTSCITRPKTKKYQLPFYFDECKTRTRMVVLSHSLSIVCLSKMYANLATLQSKQKFKLSCIHHMYSYYFVMCCTKIVQLNYFNHNILSLFKHSTTYCRRFQNSSMINRSASLFLGVLDHVYVYACVYICLYVFVCVCVVMII